MMTRLVSDGLTVFLAARSAEGVKESSLAWYGTRLGRFAKWCGDVTLSELDVNHARGFLALLRGQSERWADHPFREPQEGGLSAATIRGYGRALRQFANFLYEEGLIEVNFMERIKLPKKGQRVPKGIAYGDFIKLLDAATGSGMPERDKAIILFLADTGCRRAGLAGLRLDNLSLTRRRALVMEKGDKTRWVFFTDKTRDALQEWLAARDFWPSGGSWVFLSVKGGALTVSGINQVLRRLADRAGIEGPCNPHSFRHAFARWYIEHGGDLGTLADLLGHESVETTREFYSVFEVGELARKHQQLSPVASLDKE